MKKRVVSLVCALALALGLTAAPAGAFTFTQLDPEEVFSPELIEAEKVSDWAQAEIDLARGAGLVTEHTGSYMTRNVTRFQFAELAVNLVETLTGEALVPAAADTFSDCTEEAVLKAYAAGIVTGVGEGRFDPEAETNREQIAAMLLRTIDYLEGDRTEFVERFSDLSAFTDAGDISSWAADAMGVLAHNGLMQGSGGKLSPKDPCTVEQSILLIYRVSQKAGTPA